jgi:DNA topoisomerase III
VAGKKTRLIEFQSRQKKKFQARLEMINDQGNWKAQFFFEDARPTETSGESIGKCPTCGGDICERGKAYSCSNWKEKGCKFVIWKTMAKRKIEVDIVRQLLENGRTWETVHGFSSKKGKSFSAHLYLDDQKSVKFDFGQQPH